MKEKLVISIMISFFMINLCLAVSENSGTAAFAFLKLYSGLRAQAMGENYVAVDEGIDTIYYNPAGIAGNKNVKLSSEYMLWLDILTKSNLSFVHPSVWKIGTLGFGVDYINIPYEKRTAEDDDNYESASVQSGAIYLSYARTIKEKLTFGLNLKFIFQNFGIQGSEYSDTFGLAVDVGGIYRILDKTNVGLVVKNLGKEFAKTEDKMPVLLKLGQATKFLNDKLLFVSDLDYGIVDGTLSLGVGGEYKLTKNFYPRVGYKYIFTNNNLSFVYGINIGFGIIYKNLNFDYVFTPKDDLGNVHRIALGYSF
ncbi:MAG: PorV/PorQ family protein [Endomicrobiia bacterium]